MHEARPVRYVLGLAAVTLLIALALAGCEMAMGPPGPAGPPGPEGAPVPSSSIPMMPWVPETHAIMVTLTKAGDLPYEKWWATVAEANAVFRRSYIQVHILTEKVPGVVDVEVTFHPEISEYAAAYAYRESDPERLLCTEPCRISVWVGNHRLTTDERLLPIALGRTLAYELVHIVGRFVSDCVHPPTYHSYNERRLSDHVRQHCFAGLPPWTVPDRYW